MSGRAGFCTAQVLPDSHGSPSGTARPMARLASDGRKALHSRRANRQSRRADRSLPRPASRLAERQIATEFGRANVTVDESESPLAWLARRRGRNGRALIEPHQLQAGETAARRFHLRPPDAAHDLELGEPDFVRPPRRGGERAAAFTETMIARAPARASGARRGRSGIRRAAARRLLLPQRPRGHRARTRLAAALGQGRAATRARPAGAPLRLCAAQVRGPRAGGDAGRGSPK